MRCSANLYKKQSDRAIKFCATLKISRVGCQIFLLGNGALLILSLISNEASACLKKVFLGSGKVHAKSASEIERVNFSTQLGHLRLIFMSNYRGQFCMNLARSSELKFLAFLSMH
jgi:hypothetical protein